MSFVFADHRSNLCPNEVVCHTKRHTEVTIIGDKYNFNENDIFVRHDGLVFMHGEERSTSKSLTIACGTDEIVDQLYKLMVKLGCRNPCITEDGLPEIVDYGNISRNNITQRAIVMTAVGVFQHRYRIVKLSFVQSNEGDYLFTARQWMDNNIRGLDYGILSHTMGHWMNAIAKCYEKGINPPSLTLDNLCIGIHDRDNNNLVTSLVFDFLDAVNRNNNNGTTIAQSYGQRLREIGFIAIQLALNDVNVTRDVAEGAHRIDELVKTLFKSHWCQNFEPAFAAYFKILEETPTHPNPQFFDSLRKCFMPTYITEALRNGTKNINELYEFNRNAFDGGYQAQVYRGRHIETGRPVVLKVSSRVSLRPDYEAYRQIGAQDANIIHQNIPQLLEYGIRDGKEAIVLTDVGENLFELIEDKRLNWHSAYPRVMAQLIKALQYMHTHGICHNDLKPNNIGLGTYSTDGPNTFDHIATSAKGNAYLLDMGCSSKMPTGNAANLGKIFTWVSAQKGEQVNAHTDIFMAGTTWLFPFKKLPWTLDDGNDAIIAKKEKFMETDESIAEFIETHYHEFDRVLKSKFVEYFQKIRRVLCGSAELDYEQFQGIFYCDS